MEKKMNCPYAKQCGGCDFTDVSYEEQLKMKRSKVAKLLEPYVKLGNITGMNMPYYYRNKVTCSFGMDRKGHPVSGIYAKDSHRLVEVRNCLIEDEKADAIINTVRELIKSFKIRVFDENTGYGLLRHVMVRTGRISGEVMVVLVTASPVFPSKQNFCKALRDKHPEITTIVQNVNQRTDSLVLSDKENVFFGKGYITDRLCGKTFKISPRSFYQINPVQTEILYGKAIEFAGLTGKETVLDAYSGIGTIGIIASDSAKQVVSVELNKDAVKDAIANAKANGVKNITFYNDDAGEFMNKLAAEGDKIDVVFMDPPRQGSSEAFLKAVLTLKPSKVIYVSCGPDSLARDLKMLTKGGYKVEKAECVDMFPMTGHVETVCLLSKLREAKYHVSVTLDMDELDLTSAESKATYEEIKKYVAEHNDGMKVSSLNIAQVKRKCGIELGENYNLPKSEDAKQPQCPKEKEDAIVEALKEFKMI